MKNKFSIKEVIIVLIGNILLALGVTLFIAPSDLVMGGGTGIAFAIQHFMHIDISVTVSIINAITFVLGFLILGKKFATLTIISSIFYPIFLKIIQTYILQFHLQFDIMIAAIFGGLIIGTGVGLVLRVGASTGGMDIPPLILSKYTGLKPTIFIYMIDFIIILTQSFSISIQSLLYSFILLYISTYTINKTMMIGSNEIQVTIISPQYQKINTWIHENIHRGTTLLNITTGLKNDEQKAVMCVLSKRELSNLNKGITQIDPSSFTIISNVHEVKGKGFSF